MNTIPKSKRELYNRDRAFRHVPGVQNYNTRKHGVMSIGDRDQIAIGFGG